MAYYSIPSNQKQHDSCRNFGSVDESSDINMDY
jgi:hypothetical protein